MFNFTLFYLTICQHIYMFQRFQIIEGRLYVKMTSGQELIYFQILPSHELYHCMYCIHVVIIGLRKAIKSRKLKELEDQVAFARKNGFEISLAPELIEANDLIIRLRRLERIRAEILELKQSTVAEIRSYQKPPVQVHEVMTATFLILGHSEKETRVSNVLSLLFVCLGLTSL